MQPSDLQNHRTSVGFTLLEVLVVLSLIAIITSFALLSLPTISPERDLQYQARKLLAQLQLAHDKAILDSQTIGITVSPEQYQFSMLEDNAWVLITSGALKPQTVAHTLTLQTGSGHQKMNLPATQNTTPQLFFLPGGESTPFQLTLMNSTRSEQLTIDSSITGELTLKP